MKSIFPQVWLLAYDPKKPLAPVDQWRFFSPSDHKRFTSIRHKDTRTQFALARLLAGSVLEENYGGRAAHWTIGYEERGRPRLENCPQDAGRISISHTPGMVAFALSPRGVIGVDVENQSRKADIHLLSREVFSQGESAHFNNLSASAQRRFFFKCWTLKEAYTKALGLGLYAAFRSIEMQSAAQEGIVLKNPAPDDPYPNRLWSLHHTIFFESFHVAIAHMDPASLYPGADQWHVRPLSFEAAGLSLEALYLELKTDNIQ